MNLRISAGTAVWAVAASLSWAQGVPAAGTPAEKPGESSPAAVVATVNGRPIYVEDVEQQLNQAHSQVAEAPRPAFDLQQLLDRVVNDELLAQEARVLELQDDESIQRAVTARRTRMAVERLRREEISDRVQVSEEEMRKLFDDEYSTVSFHIVTADSEEEAAELRHRLVEGEDFETVARESSVDSAAARGGVVESQDRLKLPPEIIAAVWALEPGQLTQPVRTAQGWSVIRVDAFGEYDPARFDELKPQLQNRIRFRKSETFRVELGKRLEESLGAKVHTDRIKAIGCETQSDGRLFPAIADPSAVLAEVGDRTITAEQLGRALKSRWKGVRNEEAALATRTIVFTRMLDDLLIEVEALRRGYDDTPDVRRRADAFEKQLLIKRYLNEVVAAGVEITDEDMQKMYELRREEFRKPPRLHVSQITVETEEQAEELAKMLRDGTDLAWLARQHSIDRFKDAGGSRGWIVPQRGLDAFQDQLFDAQPRDVLGPAGVPGNYVVMQVDAREEQGYYPLEDVAGMIRTSVFRQKFQKHLEDYIRTLRSRSEIRIHDDVVASLRITGNPVEEPDAPAAPHGMP